MLLEIAIADAYGVGFEYAEPEFVRQNNRLERYFPHQGFLTLYKRYSDDTQMTPAFGEICPQISRGVAHRSCPFIFL
jgi:ADP-ribosyl-[dinitrogen reductase] hydrolase